MPDNNVVERSIYGRSMDLAGYLPPFLREYREMQALMQAEDAEFSSLQSALQGMLDHLFIQTADENMLARYEKIMGVRPAAGESMKTRRLRLLLASGRMERFTIARLIETAAQLGETVEAELLAGCKIALEFIAADAENIEILLEEFRASLPAHLEIIVRNVNSASGRDSIGGTMGLSTLYTFKEV